MEWNLTTISSWSTALQRASSRFLDLNNLIHLRLFVQVFHLFPTCLSPDFTEMLQVASNKDNDAQALREGKVWINATKIHRRPFLSTTKRYKKHVVVIQKDSQRFTKHLRRFCKEKTPKSGRIICGEASATVESQRNAFQMMLPVAQLDSWELHSICTGPVFVVWGTWQRKRGSLSDFLHMNYGIMVVC